MLPGLRRAQHINNVLRDIQEGNFLYRRSSRADDSAAQVSLTRQERADRSRETGAALQEISRATKQERPFRG